MLYVMTSGQTLNIAPRGIVRLEILYSSLVELLLMSCKFFILNIKKKKCKPTLQHSNLRIKWKEKYIYKGNKYKLKIDKVFY